MAKKEGIIKKNRNKIKLESRYYSNYDPKTLEMYFDAPKEMLDYFIPEENYPDAVCMGICLETKEGSPETVHVSPKEDYGYTEWHQVILPEDEAGELLKICEEHIEKAARKNAETMSKLFKKGSAKGVFENLAEKYEDPRNDKNPEYIRGFDDALRTLLHVTMGDLYVYMNDNREEIPC